MDKSPMDRLPAELRVIIYKKVFRGDDPEWFLKSNYGIRLEYGFTLWPTRNYMQWPPISRGDPRMALTQVCQQIRSETIGLLMKTPVRADIGSRTVLHKAVSWLSCVAKGWLDQVGRHFSKINEIEVNLPDVNLEDVLVSSSPYDDESDDPEWYGRILTDWVYLVVSNDISLYITWNLKRAGSHIAVELEHASRTKCELNMSFATTFNGDWSVLERDFHINISSQREHIDVDDVTDDVGLEEVSPAERDGIVDRLVADALANTSKFVKLLQRAHATGHGNYFSEPYRLPHTSNRA